MIVLMLLKLEVSMIEHQYFLIKVSPALMENPAVYTANIATERELNGAKFSFRANMTIQNQVLADFFKIQ